MTTINHYKNVVTKPIGDRGLARACLILIDYLYDMPDQELRMISLRTLMKELSKSKAIDFTYSAIGLLLSSRPPALDLHYIYIDEQFEYEVELDEALRALNDGSIVGKDGRIVLDVEDKLFPYYSISDEFKAIKITK